MELFGWIVIFRAVLSVVDEAAYETACWLLLQLDYKPECECCCDAIKEHRETPALCQQLAWILLVLMDLKWTATLHSTKMCLWENRVSGQYMGRHLDMRRHTAVLRSLTVEPETALHPRLAAWR